jgi:tetratricopeptide (TPR) repeat protein
VQVRGYYVNRATAVSRIASGDPASEEELFLNSETALAWLLAEQNSLVPLVLRGTDEDEARATSMIATAIGPLLLNRQLDRWSATSTAGLKAARLTGRKEIIAAALLDCGRLEHARHDYISAKGKLESALAVCPPIGTRSLRVDIRSDLGLALRYAGEPKASIRQLRKNTRSHYHASEQRLARDLTRLAGSFSDLGQYSLAVKAHEKAARIYTKLGDQHSYCSVATNLGNVYRRMGRVSEALDLHRQAAAIASEALDADVEGRARMNAAACLDDLGYYDDAVNESLAAAELFRADGDYYREVRQLVALANMAGRNGNLADSRRYAKQAITLAQQARIPFLEIAALRALAAGYFEDGGDSLRGMRYLGEALNIAETVGDVDSEVDLLTLAASALLAIDDFEAAHQKFAKAADLNRLRVAPNALYDTALAEIGRDDSFDAPFRLRMYISAILKGKDALKTTRSKGFTAIHLVRNRAHGPLN